MATPEPHLPHEAALRVQVVHSCRRLWERGLIAGQDGNVSVRLSPDRILTTPSGFSKIDLTEEDLVIVSAEGELLEGRHQPTSELAVHLRALARRPDVQAVVHAHPPTAIALSLVGRTLPEDLLPEITVLLGPVPLVPYETPGTSAVADRFDPFWADHDAFLMAHHGALTLGHDLRRAHQRMESLEHAARIVTTASALGTVNRLPVAGVEELRAMRRQMRHGG